MFGLRYFKADPSRYVIQYRNGRVRREGSGLSFFYFAPSNALMAIPMESVDVPFMFNEVSSDFQDVTVQGQVTYRVVEPATLASLMNFGIAADGSYLSEDPSRLPQRVVNSVQVRVRSLLQRLSLEQLLRGSDALVQDVSEALNQAEHLPRLGLQLLDLAILAVKPNPETARALEATVREQILKQADDATYTRRNAAIEQERAIRENELNTEIAVETKKRQIKETQLEAERAVLEKRQQIQTQELEGRIALEEKNRSLTELRAGNARIDADSKAHAVEVLMKAIQGADARVLQALGTGSADPSALIALAFQDLANNASKIGELNISPELLESLARKSNRSKGS